MIFDKFTVRKSSSDKDISEKKPEYAEISEIKNILPETVWQGQDIIALADNIQKIGLLEPIDLYFDGHIYYLIDGERRLSAYRLLGKREIKAKICTNSQDCIKLLVAKNAFGGKSVFTLAKLAAFLCRCAGFNAEEAASSMEVTTAKLFRLLRLAELSAEEKRKIFAAELSDEQALEIADICDPLLREAVINKVYSARKSLRKTIAEVRAEQSKPIFCATSLVDNSFKRLVGQISSLGRCVDLKKSENRAETVYTVRISG